jgi:hypothetical protein
MHYPDFWQVMEILEQLVFRLPEYPDHLFYGR